MDSHILVLGISPQLAGSLPKFALTATDGGNAGIAGANSCWQICELPCSAVRHQTNDQ